MVLYLDLVIFKEFIMDIILILTTVTVLKKKTNSIRILFASLVGIIDTLIDIFFHICFPIRLLLKILVSVLMIKIVYKTKDFKEFAKELFVFYIVSFVYGGILISLMFSKSLNSFLNSGKMVGKYSDIELIFAVILGLFLIAKTFKMISKNIRKDTLICKAEICIRNETIKLKLLLDTGNLLKEPITKMPVVIVEKDKLKKALYNIEKDKKIYLIPYKTLGNKTKVLFGIKPEYIKLETNNDYVFKKDVVIGLYDEKISQNDTYFGLAGIDIIEKEWVIWKV